MVNYWREDIYWFVFVIVFFVVIVVINFVGVRGYGEVEFCFFILKVIVIIGFIFLGCVINIGGFFDEGYIGGRYWKDFGVFNNGFKGFCIIFVVVVFVFMGIELVGLVVVEVINLRKLFFMVIK